MSTWNDKPNDYEHAIAEIERLRAGIQNYLDGNYDTAAKNDKCKHGRYGFEGCENCIDEHFMKLLDHEQSASEAKK